ncbi:hypothetical protein Micbo1qcDRAFT_206705 [Microdochium bolleyi]|uniref:Uncharacterized protein n=1 Tax=Microdochium bolleyi TaxID=196109 RepID=A0A136IWI2_9PEZI|nr:hypothetical protein Micbo1qcDRAFT_206705 [Microdochium bolleyi]
MKTKSLIASLLCAAANAAVLERREQCLTGTLACYAALSTVPAAASYCAQSFPIAPVTVTATATELVSATITLTQTVTTTTSTTTTDLTSETTTETQTDTTTATSTSYTTPAPAPSVVKRAKGRCNTNKVYPTISATSSGACAYDAPLLCDLVSKSPEQQGEVCSCIQQAATATLTASITETTSVTEAATAVVTTITLFTTTGTSLATTTTTATATVTTGVTDVCKQPVAECFADNQCCSGICGRAFFTPGNACCNPVQGPCDVAHPEMCCSGTCYLSSPGNFVCA